MTNTEYASIMFVFMAAMTLFVKYCSNPHTFLKHDMINYYYMILRCSYCFTEEMFNLEST